MLAVMNVGSTLYKCTGKPGIAEISTLMGCGEHSTQLFFFFWWGCLALSTGMGRLKYRSLLKYDPRN